VWPSGALAVLPLLALLALPLVTDSHPPLTLATTAVVYGIIASGLGLVYGRLGYLSMSHALLWGVGSYTGAILITDHGWSFWLALPAAIVLATIAGAITALPAVRLRGHHFLIAGFILTQIAVVLEKQLSITGGANGKTVDGLPSKVLGVDFGTVKGFYYLCVIFLALSLVLSAVIYARPIGRRFVAIRENSRLAETLGISFRKEVIVGFTLSGIYGGLGGYLYALNLGHIEPDSFGLSAAILLPLVVMVGGARLIWGPPLGAFIVVFLPEVIHASPTAAQAINGILLIVIILVMPNGVLGGLASLVGLRRKGSSDAGGGGGQEIPAADAGGGRVQAPLAVGRDAAR
jgi:branched-chain amino acid transport system permease protein